MIRLQWNDLSIEDVAPDWLVPWSGVVEGRVAPAFMNKFGFWFLRRAEGSVEMLDVFQGRLDRVAQSYDEFMQEVNQPWWQEAYLLSESVFRLHEADMIPEAGQCYALAPHPALGGPNPFEGDAVDPRFVTMMDIPLWQSLCAGFVRGRFPVGRSGRDSLPRLQ